MKQLHSELAKYEDLVAAVERQTYTGRRDEIRWDSAISEGIRYSPHSVIVGKVSDELRQMGFMSMFTYDKEHLQESMHPEENELYAHSHGMSIQEMIDLPKLINKPVAIVTERDGSKRTIEGSEYRCLHFIFQVDRDGDQKYYRAVVQPQAHHNGLLVNGLVSKIITYHSMDEMRFNSMMKDVLNQKRNLLYFDRDQYMTIRSESKPIPFLNYVSGSVSIEGHFTRITRLADIANEHKAVMRQVATSTMNKLIVGRGAPGTSLPLFNDSLKTLSDKTSSIADLISARNTILKISTLSNDRMLRLRVKDHVDRLFAEAYLNIVTHDKQAKYIERALQKVKAIEVCGDDDVEFIRDEMERIANRVPTLKNLGVNFSDTAAKAKCIVDARERSGEFEELLERKMSELLEQKIGEMQIKSRNVELDLDGYDRED